MTATAYIPGVARAAVLVDLTIRTYTGRRRDRQTQDEVQAAKGAASSRAASVTKLLFAGCAELENIVKFQASVRTRHYTLTLPWSDNGSRLLPIAALPRYQQEMNGYRARFDEMVRVFLDRYDTLVAAAAFQLGALFDRSEYPSRERIAKRFSLDTAFSPLPLAGDFRITAEISLHSHLVQEYEDRSARLLEQAQRDAWTRLHSTLTHLADRLTDGEDGERNRIFASLVDKPLELCDLLDTFNVTQDPALARASERLRNVMLGTSATELREHADARQHVREKVTEILSDYDWAPLDE